MKSVKCTVIKFGTSTSGKSWLFVEAKVGKFTGRALANIDDLDGIAEGMEIAIPEMALRFSK